MSLFGSKSSSSSSTTNYSEQQSTSIGDLSHDNIVAQGDLTITNEGLSGDNLQMIFDNNALALDKSISSVQNIASKAIETTGKSYADAYSGSQAESSRFFDALRPFAVIAAVVAIFYYGVKNG